MLKNMNSFRKTIQAFRGTCRPYIKRENEKKNLVMTILKTFKIYFPNIFYIAIPSGKKNPAIQWAS